MRKYYLLLSFLGFLLFSAGIHAQTENAMRNIHQKSKVVRKTNPKRMSLSKTTQTGVLTQQSQKQHVATKAYQPKKMYGYLVYDDVLYDLSLCYFNFNDLSTIHILDMGTQYYPDLACGAFGNGLYYYYGCDDEAYAKFFASVDLETNERTILNDYELEDYFIAYDMTYDYSTHTMYALVSTDDGDTSTLATIDLTNGKMETIADLDDYYVALAATYDGTLYGMSLSGDLYALDKEDGTPQFVLETGIVSDYIQSQSMDFDHTDESLYWSSYVYHEVEDYYESAFIKIDIENKTVEDLGVIGNNAEICGLYIPFVRNSLNSPTEASEVSLAPDSNGGNSAVLSWKNPETTLNEDPLTELTKVEIYRNNALIKTFDHPEPGASLSYEDQEVETGLYTYKIIAHNSAGEGVPAMATGFIGHDVPAAVTNLLLTKENERTGKLTWEVPVTGLHGGWIDQSSLAYNITRYPDMKTVANEHPTNEFIDPNLTSLNNYYYTVEAVTSDGKGGITESNTVLIGQALTLPYKASFTIAEAGKWEIIDGNNDGKTWTFDNFLADYFFKDAPDGAYCFGANEGADEWLITSPMTLEGSKSYKLSLNTQVSTKGENATLEITAGKRTDITTHKLITTLEISNFTPEEKKVSIVGLENGEYTIGLHLKTNDHSMTRITQFEVDKCTASYASGIVSSGQQPLNGVLVQVKAKNKEVIAEAKTNAKGEYTLPYIEKGTYFLCATSAGYEYLERELVIDEPEILKIDMELTKTDEIVLNGKVENEKKMPLATVSIVLRGAMNYQATTKEDGTFEIPNVAIGKYRLIAYKNGYEQHASDIELSADKQLNVITLTHKVLAPSEVSVRTDHAHPVISWKEPVDKMTFRYDNGKQTSDFGINGGDYYSVAGSVYRQPVKLTAASWFTIDDGYDDHDYVNLFIFDLDKNGEPTHRILCNVDGIKNNNGSWTTYAFEEPVDCPNGFIVALSVDDGYIALGATDGDETYPFLPETQCSSRDFENKAFYYLEELDYNNIFMIRAEGIPTGAPMKHPAKVIGSDKRKSKLGIEEHRLYSRQPKSETARNERRTSVADSQVYPLYNVYRLKAGEEAETEKWTLLTQQPVAAFTFTDEDWNTLSQGYYKYAVQAVYTENRLSETALSEAIGKEVHTSIVYNITTNVSGTSAEGTSVKLTGDKSSYTETADASGKVTFNHVLKGTYHISARLKGCKEYAHEADYSEEATYTADIKLLENITVPHNLTVNKSNEEHIYQLSWNEFSVEDDFENHPDFAINSPGEAGWQYIDGDGSVTKGFKDGSTGEWYQFENMFSPMAFIVFNPSAVEPTMEKEFQAHSGSKFLACMGGEIANDDYLISPELDGSDSFILKFFALSYDGNDRMEVGYSFNGMESEEFVWNSGIISVNAAKEWREYSFEMPAGVRYVAIRCISLSPMIFMIDDVCITSDKETSQAATEGLGAHEYEIYLDGQKVATQRGISYRFANLKDGKHIAGVKAVYQSGISEMATTEFESIGTGIQKESNEEVILYPNPVKDDLYVKGETVSIEIYNINGVLTGTYDSPTKIALNHLDDGVYTARIITKKGISMKKIIIRK